MCYSAELTVFKKKQPQSQIKYLQGIFLKEKEQDLLANTVLMSCPVLMIKFALKINNSLWDK